MDPVDQLRAQGLAARVTKKRAAVTAIIWRQQYDPTKYDEVNLRHKPPIDQVVDTVFAADPTPEKEYVFFLLQEYFKQSKPMYDSALVSFPDIKRALDFFAEDGEQIKKTLLAYKALSSLGALPVIQEVYFSLWYLDGNDQKRYIQYSALRNGLLAKRMIAAVAEKYGGVLPEAYKAILPAPPPKMTELLAAAEFTALQEKGEANTICQTENFALIAIRSPKAARYLSPRTSLGDPAWCIAREPTDDNDIDHFKNYDEMAAKRGGWQYVLLSNDGTNAAYTIIWPDGIDEEYIPENQGRTFIDNEKNTSTTLRPMFDKHPALLGFLITASSAPALPRADANKIKLLCYQMPQRRLEVLYENQALNL